MKTKKILLVFLILLPIWPNVICHAAKLDLNGYYTLYPTLIVPSKITNEGTLFDNRTQGILEQHLRLKLSYQPISSIYFETAYELLPLVIDKKIPDNNLLPQIDYFCYRLYDFNQNLLPVNYTDENFLLKHNLDRVFINFTTGIADFKIGRQPVSFGSARTINPTDVLAPLTYGSVGTAQVVGIDAARVQIPLGFTNEIDLGAIPCEEKFGKNGAYFARNKFNVFKTNFTLLAMSYHTHFLAGLDIIRSIAGAGVWVEGAYTLSKAFDGGLSRENFIRVSTGIDYNFNVDEGFYAALEYHYNGASSNNPENYLSQRNSTAYDDSSVYLMGRHYLIPRIFYQISPLVNIDFSSLINLTDASFYLYPTLDYNIRKNTFIGASVLFPLGKRALVQTDSTGLNTVVPSSEFGLYSTYFYTYLKFFF